MPLAPISVPVFIKRILVVVSPIKRVVQQENELSIDMMIGISAPPMGKMKEKPKIDDNRIIAIRDFSVIKELKFKVIKISNNEIRDIVLYRLGCEREKV